MQQQQLTGELSETLESQRDSIFSDLRVSIPGIIQDVNMAKLTCTVQPAVMGYFRDSSGNITPQALPLLNDVPLCFANGGNIALTMPVKAGDECLLIFSDRCIDFWWQNGGVQEPVDPRQHDLSDAFALVGVRSQARMLKNISTDSMQIRTVSGDSFIELTEDGTINLKTAGFSGTINTDGTANLAGKNITINGAAITEQGDFVTKAGVSLDTLNQQYQKHVHGGVENGGGQTGTPQ